MKFSEYVKIERKLLNAVDGSIVDDIVDEIVQTAKCGGRVFVCGNGGSFLTVEHFAEDAMKGAMFNLERMLPIIVLGSNPGMQMAIANDIGWESIFQYELQCMQPTGDDMIIGLSVSGNSENVINAIEHGNMVGMTTVGFVGKNGTGQLAELANINVIIKSDHFGLVEDVHSACLHYMAYRLMEAKTWED